jgi:GT2 family glycosyltransferase
VIPTYNHVDYLKGCIESIRKWTNLESGDVEVIVVANGCTDGTKEYLDSLPTPVFMPLYFAEPLGFTKAANMGIRAATGEFVVLLNNDTVLLSQPKNQWLDLLLAPFLGSHRVGLSGPVKFHWDCAGTRRRAIAFWCVMIRRQVFDKIGYLDEVFSPGMGEDADFSIKAQAAGFALVRVPKDGEEEFGKGITDFGFPIYHAGSGTFRDKDYSDVQKRNEKILEARYGAKGDRLEEIYNICANQPTDTNALFPDLRRYAEGCRHITEFGVRGVFTTWAFLAAHPKRLIGYDIVPSYNAEEAKAEAVRGGVEYEFRVGDTLKIDIEETDLLFIDTLHTYAQLKSELERHHSKVREYILIHDTESFGLTGEDGGPGEKRAVEEFLVAHPEWVMWEHLPQSNGLTVLTRDESKELPTMSESWHAFHTELAASIVIPTCGKDWQNVLKKCLEAVYAATELGNKEVIVVPNGAPAEALQWLKEQPVRVLQFPERIGYIRAVNAGIASAGSEYVVLLDDDSFLLPQDKDAWISLLKAPFLKEQAVAASSPFSKVYPDLGQVLHSGCTMYRKSALLKVHLFDEAFNPGYLGDEDLAIRLRKAGYKLSGVPEGYENPYVNGVFQVAFPIIHTGTVNTMPKNTTDLPLVANNRELLLQRHGRKCYFCQKTGSRVIWVQGANPGCGYDRCEPPCAEQGGVDAGAPLGEAPGLAGYAGQPAPSLPRRAQSSGYPKTTIIIPTYKNNFHTDERTGQRFNILQRNLECLREYTDLKARNIEVLVVCNGCKDGQEDMVRAMGEPFRVISFPERLGYTKATNEGIKASEGEFLLFLNDDAILLPQRKSEWFDWMIEHFLRDPLMGVTGPLQLHDRYAEADVIIGFCLMVRRSIMQKVMAHVGGLLDEIFSPGGGEDIDLCVRMRLAGYKVRQVPREGKLGFGHTNEGEFQIWHLSNQTFKDIPEYTRWYVKRNGAINMKRFNKSIRLNLGAGGIDIPGTLSLDLHDNRAEIIGDALQLDLDNETVAEIYAIHLFEHLSPYKADDALREWFRVLKPGGRLVMEMPNVEELCKQFTQTKDFDKRWGVLNALYAPVNTTGEGAPTDITSPHLYGYWPEELEHRLIRIGYTDIRFGPEQFPHPYPPNMHVEATKPLVGGGTVLALPPSVAPGFTRPMKDLWQPPPGTQKIPFGDPTTYKKAMDFLCGCDVVEDWGCGTGFAQTYMKEGVYIGVDGSRHDNVSVHTELALYTSKVEGILMRHLIEHNVDWRAILGNAVQSFTRKMVLILCTPFSEKTERIATNWHDIPDLSFRREDILECFAGLHVQEEALKTATQYGQEHIFYVSK